jgi:predicted metal-dependent HD superfamily phosphohydrolase
MATCHRALPVSLDEQWLVDVDLAILGTPAPRFAQYELQIRQEYAFVPEALFRSKRREILSGFLARPTIYSTPHFRSALEHTARINLDKAVAAGSV